MPTQTVLIIRHAERPDDNTDPSVKGVAWDGQEDPESLTPRGWQRAGAWVQLFDLQSFLPKPTALYASDPVKIDDQGSKSRRPLETITPLADILGLTINTDYAKGQEQGLADAVSAYLAANGGVALICWQHERILDIARSLTTAADNLPIRKWPGKVFNVVFRFDRGSSDAPWTFQQSAPMMLAGDQPNLI